MGFNEKMVDFPMTMAIEIVDFPMNGDFPMKNGDFP